MNFTFSTERLTSKALVTMLEAALEKADGIGQPQRIVIVDPSGIELATLRMAGAKVLSLRSARAKAQTAASTGKPSSLVPEPVRAAIAVATEGAMTALPGGFPIWRNGVLLGGLGVGSGSGEQDKAMAEAALNAVGASWAADK